MVPNLTLEQTFERLSQNLSLDLLTNNSIILKAQTSLNYSFQFPRYSFGLTVGYIAQNEQRKLRGNVPIVFCLMLGSFELRFRIGCKWEGPKYEVALSNIIQYGETCVSPLVRWYLRIMLYKETWKRIEGWITPSQGTLIRFKSFQNHLVRYSQP